MKDEDRDDDNEEEEDEERRATVGTSNCLADPSDKRSEENAMMMVVVVVLGLEGFSADSRRDDVLLALARQALRDGSVSTIGPTGVEPPIAGALSSPVLPIIPG